MIRAKAKAKALPHPALPLLAALPVFGLLILLLSLS
jgi:hypothetical protein